MSMTNVNPKRQKLEQILEVLLKNLQEQGLLPKMEPDEKKQLIANIVEKTLNNINNLEQIQEKSVKKALSLCLISEFVAEHQPAFKAKLDRQENLEKLFDKNLSPKELQLEASKHLALLLTALNELIAKPELRLTPEVIQQQAETLAAQCIQGNDKDCLAENDAVMNRMALLMNDLLADTLGNLYGNDPRVAGAPIKPVFVAKGNLASIVDQGGDSTAAFAFLRFDGKEDPLGIENSIRVRLDATSSVLEDELKEIGAYSSAPMLRPE